MSMIDYDARPVTPQVLLVGHRASPIPSVARQLKRCPSGIVNAGLIEGHLLLRQHVPRGVRWLAQHRETSRTAGMVAISS